MKFGIEFGRDLGLSRASKRRVIDKVNDLLDERHTVTKLFPWARHHNLYVSLCTGNDVFIEGNNHDGVIYNAIDMSLSQMIVAYINAFYSASSKGKSSQFELQL